ncbi:terminase small subunit [Sinorhizobium medicae]|uniref:terminase small subunit n=1 Tax=Sinorhizobium medicae TaxID=110321 RepID=UPI001FB52DD1|nr:terminase small subunit [Sinorhizobium medicae]
MPVLKNARHEKFAQALAKGKTADDAYAEAGSKPDRGNASRLQQKDNIRQRVAQLLEWEQTVERKATEKAIDKLAITKERVLAELAKIGFADIRRAIKWQGTFPGLLPHIK